MSKGQTENRPSRLRQPSSFTKLFLLLNLTLAACQANPTITPEVFAQPTITPTETPLPIPTRTSVPTPTPTPTPEKDIYTLTQSRIKKISRDLRQKRKQENPEMWQQVIAPEMQTIPPTVLFLGCGFDVTLADPKARTCPNRLSILGDDGVSFFILTHDTGFPIAPGILARSDWLWSGPGGNFARVREGFQTAIAAPIDVIIVFENKVIGDFVEESLGNRLTFVNPIAFTAQKTWVDKDTLVPEAHFPAGPITLDRKLAIQFATSTPKSDGPYPPSLENHSRIDTLINAVFAEIEKRQSQDPGSLNHVLKSTGKLMLSSWISGNLASDLDVRDLIDIMFLVATENPKAQFPSNKIRESTYLADPSISPSGLKGVMFGTKDNDPYIKRAGYPDGFFAIPDHRERCALLSTRPDPCGANFYAPFPWKEYWQPVQKSFRDFVIRN